MQSPLRRRPISRTKLSAIMLSLSESMWVNNFGNGQESTANSGVASVLTAATATPPLTSTFALASRSTNRCALALVGSFMNSGSLRTLFQSTMNALRGPTNSNCHGSQPPGVLVVS